MRVLHVSYSDRRGGAAIATWRLVQAQRAAGLDARMLVLDKMSDEDWVALAPASTRLRARIARAAVKRVAGRFAASDPQALRTLAVIPTGLGKAIDRFSPDLVHWHWIGAESIAMAEMAAVPYPSVWTCQDEWAWCGAEHYAQDDRFRTGYQGTDIDARIFRRKQRDWRGFQPAIVVPSAFTASRCAQSLLFGGAPATVVPNSLDFEEYRLVDRAACREQLGCKPDERVILFGAQGGSADPRKGFDLLLQSLELLRKDGVSGVRLMVFGGTRGETGEIAGIPYFDLGHLSTAAELVRAYTAADLYVTPSRQETFGNTTLESLACGTPCVAFATGGAPEMLADPAMGSVIAPYDCVAFADAMKHWLGHEQSEELRQQRNRFARTNFASSVAADKAMALYSTLLGRDTA